MLYLVNCHYNWFDIIIESENSNKLDRVYKYNKKARLLMRKIIQPKRVNKNITV